MADTSPITVITNRIVSLLVGNENTYFAKQCLAGNRFSKLSGTPWPVTPPPNFRNLTRCTIDCTSDNTPTRNQMKTFCNVNSANGDVVIQQKSTFALTFVYKGVDRSIGNQMIYFLSGVLLADPKLGLTSPIINVSGQLDVRWQEANNDTTGGQNGLIQTINFPVTIELHRADLIAAAAYTG